MYKKLIIFDLDGTLLNTMEDIAAACNHALETHGYPTHRQEEYNMMVGRGITNLISAALPEDMRTDATTEKVRASFVKYYNSHICDMTRPYDGIPELLDRLSEEGFATAVASNKYQKGTEVLINTFFSSHKFINVLGQREGHPIKPDPSIIFEIMENAEVGRSATFYCGDSDIDMMAGANAGVRTVGVTWGFRSREELISCSPWMTAETPEDIFNAVLSTE